MWWSEVEILRILNKNKNLGGSSNNTLYWSSSLTKYMSVFMIHSLVCLEMRAIQEGVIYSYTCHSFNKNRKKYLFWQWKYIDDSGKNYFSQESGDKLHYSEIKCEREESLWRKWLSNPWQAQQWRQAEKRTSTVTCMLRVLYLFLRQSCCAAQEGLKRLISLLSLPDVRLIVSSL
jgi:hypothetical protein